MVLIPAVAGFQMGSPPTINGTRDEQPVHAVDIAGFSISKYEVTIAQYARFLNAGGNDAHWNTNMRKTSYCGIVRNRKGDYSVVPGRAHFPVVYVTWNDAAAYCEWLSVKRGEKYRLPTEAEWEYAYRAKTSTKYYWGDGIDADYMWYDYNSKNVTHHVGNKKANGWGLYDMSGNALEWVSDWYDAGYYQASPRDNPQGPSSGENKVLRGGAFNLYCLDDYCRAGRRIIQAPGSVNRTIGFRPVKS
jgi:formylglycine-generating enzyme required for sulfatase activity